MMYLLSQLPNGHTFTPWGERCQCVLRKIGDKNPETGYIPFEVVTGCDFCRATVRTTENFGWSSQMRDHHVDYDPLAKELEETFG